MKLKQAPASFSGILRTTESASSLTTEQLEFADVVKVGALSFKSCTCATTFCVVEPSADVAITLKLKFLSAS